MQKSAPSPARIAVMAGFALSCFGLILFLWLAFGGPIPLKPQGYRFQVAFPDATQLAEQADVRIAGVTVGKVVAKRAAPEGNRTLATIQLQPEFVPIRRNARAILRLKTLLGETYIEMTPGTRSAPPLPDGGRLADARVQPALQIADVLKTFDRPTRRAFELWQQRSARAVRGRGADLNAALGALPAFASDGRRLLQVLDQRPEMVRRLVRNTGTVFASLTQDERALQQAISRTTQVFGATASRSEALAQSVHVFPTFLRESRATLARLQIFARDTDPLIRDLQPVLRDLQPTLRDVRRLAPDLDRFFARLPALIDASRTGLPATTRLLRGADPLLAGLGPFLQELVPVLRWLELNQGMVSDFLSVGPSAFSLTAATPQGGQKHALPQLIVAGSQSLITPTRTPDNRGNAYLAPNALADPGLKKYFTFPNWDCNTAGGTHPPQQGSPGCFVQAPIPFQGQSLRFPHVTRDAGGGGGK